MCKIAMQSSQVDLLEKRVKLSMYSLKSDAVGTTVKRGGGGGGRWDMGACSSEKL